MQFAHLNEFDTDQRRAYFLLCAAVCPNNIATTINDFVQAFFHDLMVALRLFLSCFGPGGPAACVCNILMLMKPAWVNNLPTNQAKCKGGNIFGLLVDKITDVVLLWAEYLVNKQIAAVEKAVCGWFGCNFGRICLTVGLDKYRCSSENELDDLEWMLGCGFRGDTREARRCFFSRQRAICMEGDPSRYTRYQKLFEAPNKEELEEDFWSIVGKYAWHLHSHPYSIRSMFSKTVTNVALVPAAPSTPSHRRSTRRSTDFSSRPAQTCGRKLPRICAIRHCGTPWTSTRL